MAEARITNLTVLAIFPRDEDQVSLARILAHSNWTLTLLKSFRETQIALRKTLPGVVISDSSLSDGHCWRDLLIEIETMEDPPLLIVADRLADDRLWAEVLNLGAHDLLAKPFDKREVLYAVSTACRRREHHRVLRSRQSSPLAATTMEELKTETELVAASGAAVATLEGDGVKGEVY
jgi:DNA-binding response OmpR family regulator